MDWNKKCKQCYSFIVCEELCNLYFGICKSQLNCGVIKELRQKRHERNLIIKACTG